MRLEQTFTIEAEPDANPELLARFLEKQVDTAPESCRPFLARLTAAARGEAVKIYIFADTGGIAARLMLLTQLDSWGDAFERTGQTLIAEWLKSVSDELVSAMTRAGERARVQRRRAIVAELTATEGENG